MSYRTISVALTLTVVSYCALPQRAVAADGQFDPLRQITSAFPKTLEIKNGGRLLEFCPDNTCDAFEASASVSRGDLKDFTYLYVYFFSDYYILQEWRAQAKSKETAERVLSKLKYQSCKGRDDLEAARCALRALSSNGRIKLLFVRYDENQRNVVKKDLAEQLSRKAPAPNE